MQSKYQLNSPTSFSQAFKEETILIIYQLTLFRQHKLDPKAKRVTQREEIHSPIFLMKIGAKILAKTLVSQIQ